MATAPWHIWHLALEVFRAGYWFRVEGDRLFVVARHTETPPLPDDLAERIRTHKPVLINAARDIPTGCKNRPGHLFMGECANDTCTHGEAA